MHWHSPEAFWLLIVWALIAIYYFSKGRRNKNFFRFSSLKTLPRDKGWRANLLELPAVLQFICLLLLIIALARPQTTRTHTRRSAKGVDIVIVLDTSDSMLIEDMEPNSRIVAAKKVITQFINGLVHDRVGLIVFAGESYTRVPLTLDYPVLLSSLKEVQTSHYDPFLKPGTAIGVALAGATARLRLSKAKSKVVIFLTDGENNTGVINPGTALDIVKQYNIKVYTIGVGSKKGSLSRIPRKMIDHRGKVKTIYQTVQSQINEKLLKQIAIETKGEYFRAGNAYTLEKIFAHISKLEKSPIDTTKWQEYQDLFPDLLKKALVFYLISLFLMLTVFWRTI